jgi:hypothetical protein
MDEPGGSHELASSRDSSLLRTAGAGGASRDRTDDLRVANATLSQLSYGPSLKPRALYQVRTLVGLGGVAPPTSPLSGVRSN